MPHRCPVDEQRAGAKLLRSPRLRINMSVERPEADQKLTVLEFVVSCEEMFALSVMMLIQDIRGRPTVSRGSGVFSAASFLIHRWLGLGWQVSNSFRQL